MPVFALDGHEALKVGKEMFPDHRVMVVREEGESCAECPLPIDIAVEQLPRSQPRQDQLGRSIK